MKTIKSQSEVIILSEKVQRMRIKTLIEFLKNEKIKGRLLDIGCQEEEITWMLHKEGFEAHGVDINYKQIKKAKQKYPQIEFKQANCGNKIPFPNNLFDVVWAGDVIEHICNTDIFINEVSRVLKIIVLFIFEKHFDPEFPHYKFYTLKSLRKELEKRGFRINRVKTSI